MVANVENAAGGSGITREIGDSIRDHGVDVMTSGNHIWAKREALDYIQLEPRLLRPANFPAGAPGSGHVIVNTRSGDPGRGHQRDGPGVHGAARQPVQGGPGGDCDRA